MNVNPTELRELLKNDLKMSINSSDLAALYSWFDVEKLGVIDYSKLINVYKVCNQSSDHFSEWN